jgi:hypothetical protein
MFNSELLVYQRVVTTMDSCNISYQPDVGIVCDLPLNAEPAKGPDHVGGNHPQLSDSNSRPSYGGARH